MAKEGNYLIQSVVRALTMIDILSDHKSLGVSELSRIIGLHKSTVFGLLTTLENQGYVCQNKNTGKYELTLKLFQIGSKVFGDLDLRNIAKPYLNKLVEIHEETAHLVVPDGTEVIYIDKVESTKSIRICSRVGTRLPFYCTGVGKVLLSFKTDEEINEILNAKKLKAYTKNTLIQYDSIINELKKIREQGYAIDNEEIEEGLRCVAAPIFDINGKVIAATSISGPTMRMTEDKVRDIVKDIISVNNRISAELGYQK